jgi:hypothetical protein
MAGELGLMSHRQIKVRTALDTVMELKAIFDLANIKSENYDSTAKKEAANLNWFIRNNCSVAFEEEFRALFLGKQSNVKEPIKGE